MTGRLSAPYTLLLRNFEGRLLRNRILCLTRGFDGLGFSPCFLVSHLLQLGQLFRESGRVRLPTPIAPDVLDAVGGLTVMHHSRRCRPVAKQPV